ncbi:MAG: DUF1269 domain-containing protein [Proteobacteria bacterium]|nr:DUF1269 domain-containing protein [Pseudomonadota bacterium]
MADQSVVGIYTSMETVEGAVRTLDQGGFPITQVSIVAQNMENEKKIHGFMTTGDIAKTGAGTGAWFGGIFGLLIGAAFLWIPAVGPLLVAGPLAAALIGGMEGLLFGAASGGLMGVLMGWGVSKKHIIKYEEHLKSGKYLLIAHGSADEVARARNILGSSGSEELNIHSDSAEE